MNESAAAGKMPWDVDLLSTADKLNYKRDAKAKTRWNVFPFLHDTKGKNSIWVRYGEGFIFSTVKRQRMKKKGSEEYISGTSLSLYGSVNAFCCCLRLLCSARVDQCLLPHCLWRPSLVMRSYRLCLKCPHILSYTNTGKPTHTHTVQTEKSVQGRPQKQTHKLCLHLSLLCFNPSHFCTIASVSRFEAF